MTAEAVRSETPIYTEDANTVMMAVGCANSGYRTKERTLRAKSEPSVAMRGAEKPDCLDGNDSKQASGSTNRGFIRFVRGS